MCSGVRCAVRAAGEGGGLSLGFGVQPGVGLVKHWHSDQSLDPPILFVTPP